MPLTWSRVGARNRLIQCSQELRVELVTLVDAGTFLRHESSPRFQSDASEFVRRHPVQFRFNFGIAHDGGNVVLSVGKVNFQQAGALSGFGSTSTRWHVFSWQGRAGRGRGGGKDEL